MLGDKSSAMKDKYVDDLYYIIYLGHEELTISRLELKLHYWN